MRAVTCLGLFDGLSVRPLQATSFHHHTAVPGPRRAAGVIALRRYGEVHSLVLPLARRCEPGDKYVPLLQQVIAEALYKADGASRDDVFKAATILEDVLSLMRRRCGAGHPGTVETLTELDRVRMMLEDKFQQ